MKTNKQNPIIGLFKDLWNSIREHYPLIILVLLSFALVSVINFFDMSMSQTIASFKLDEFEIGQIADRTIYAPRTIPADEMNPVFIEEGEKLIRKGFPITEEGYSKLQKMVESPVYLDYRAFANSELYLVILCVMWFILFAFAPFNRKLHLREFIFQVICFLLVYGGITFGLKSQYFTDPFMMLLITPASMMILFDSILYGQLSSVFFSFILSFGIFEASGYLPVPFIYTLASCLAAGFIVRNIERRMDMILVSIMLAIFNMIAAVILAVIFNEQFSRSFVILLCGCALNGFLSGILTLALLTPVELLLNTASVFRLMDLCDTNVPTLKKLFLSASGTYQHSQMVGQLAENACREIGANALLAKVGAWYHDIGKMDQSEYFAENQQDGINPHDKIAPSLSASILRSHVRKGIEKGRQMHLPQQVIDIIEEHHGNSLISFFYDKALKADPNTNKLDYMYPGNPPSSKESGVVMLADTVEAACRTLSNPTEERLDKFIQTLITSKMEHGQLDKCALTFSDLYKIRTSFVKLLVGVYHNRVKYPNQKDPSEMTEKTIEEAKNV